MLFFISLKKKTSNIPELLEILKITPVSSRLLAHSLYMLIFFFFFLDFMIMDYPLDLLAISEECLLLKFNNNSFDR